MSKLTPMMQQYMDVKNKYKDCILFFRLGDFYEMFFDDAIEASRVLEIALTGKNCGLEERAPMCGVPFHSAASYISKLVESGYKVAIAEQMEEAGKGKTLVKRDVVRVVTPGTVLEENLLENKKNNYLMSLYIKKDYTGICYVDISTGELSITKTKTALINEEIARISPKEILINDISYYSKIEKMAILNNVYINKEYNELFYESDDILYNYFDNSYYENLNIIDNEFYKSPLIAIFNYIFLTQKHTKTNISKIDIVKTKNFMVLDTYTRRNLELKETLRNKKKKGSLLYVLDKTNTPMGGRLLRKFVDEPLKDKSKIETRLNLVEEAYNDFIFREDVQEILKEIYDIERLCGKIAFEKIMPKELINLKQSLENIPRLKEKILNSNNKNFKSLMTKMEDLEDIKELLEDSILESPSNTIKDGNIIKEEYDDRVKELRHISKNGAQIVKEIEAKEREKLNIKSLKVSFNKVFGYYIEITKANLKDLDIPLDYVRKQTLANSERFITQELKEIEEKILNSEEKIKEIEYNLFLEIREKLYKNINRIQKVAKTIASIDVFLSLGKIAYDNNYKKPNINTDNILDIKEGRHPVIEKLINDEQFISNNTYLDDKKDKIGIITGPNMSGKSTYMRQVAIITLMAHIGSFVPCDDANIPITDRIFTRVGASDDLSQGESTFMVEMNEVSNILKNATKDSLIILDEIGRGTSTFDGLSIAWAIVEYINKKICAKTLFATHYHELTELEDLFDGIRNYSVSVKESGEDVVFLRKIIKGGANKSYGIHVAKLAKLPNEVIKRSNQILKQLESSDITRNKDAKLFKQLTFDLGIDTKITDKHGIENVDSKDEDLKSSSSEESKKENIDENNLKILNKLKELDVSNTTPIDALNLLYELKKMVN